MHKSRRQEVAGWRGGGDCLLQMACDLLLLAPVPAIFTPSHTGLSIGERRNRGVTVGTQGKVGKRGEITTSFYIQTLTAD
jgi:hypothetical protein